MDRLIKTITAALIVLILTMIGLGIGWLISGKNRLRKGCGRQLKDPTASSTCSLCGDKQTCEDQKNDNNSSTNAHSISPRDR